MKKFLSVLLCVCLMFTTVMAVPSVSAEEQAKEYDYIACDYENLADVDTETWFGKADAVTASLETTAPIDGTASLRISKNATGYGGFSVFPDDVALKAGTYYRVTATAQVQSGSFNLGRLGNMGSKADGTYNWTHIHTNAAYTGESDNGGTPLILWTQWVEKGASAAFTKQGTIKVSENTQFSHLGMADGENSYTGNGYLKYLATEKDNGQSRFVLSGTEALKDFATPGDQIKLSFKYKLLSGDAKYYLHTSAAGDQVNLTKDATGNWLNVYKYKQVNLTASEDWQELSVTYDLKSYSEITAIGATLDDFLYTVLIFSSENGAEFYIDDIALDVIPGIKVKTAYNNAAALRSAAASSTGKNGVRIYNEIDTHWVAEKNIVEYGSVAAFASNIEGEITLDNGIKGVAYSAADEISSVWEVTEHTVVFTSYLTNIAASKFNEDIVIRSYAIAEDGTVYYGSTATVSVFEVANAIDNANTADGSEPTEEDANAFYTFVTDANSSAYASWCAENEKTIGALYNDKYSA